MPKNESNIRYDDFVSAIRSEDPTRRLALLKGYIGQSSEDGYIRVFLDAALNNFIDVMEEDVVYAKELSEENSPIGGSLLWVLEESEFKYGDPRSKRRPTSSFLQGDLMAAYQRAGVAGTAGGINQISPGIIDICHGFITNHCQSIWTNPCQNFATNDCSFVISACGNINTFVTCDVIRSIVPTTGCGTVISNPTGCGSIQTATCGITRTFVPTTGCSPILSNPCGTTISVVPTGCGLNYSTLPPTTFMQTTVVQTGQFGQAQTPYATGFETYNPYGTR